MLLEMMPPKIYNLLRVLPMDWCYFIYASSMALLCSIEMPLLKLDVLSENSIAKPFASKTLLDPMALVVAPSDCNKCHPTHHCKA